MYNANIIPFSFSVSSMLTNNKNNVLCFRTAKGKRQKSRDTSFSISSTLTLKEEKRKIFVVQLMHVKSIKSRIKYC